MTKTLVIIFGISLLAAGCSDLEPRRIVSSPDRAGDEIRLDPRDGFQAVIAGSFTNYPRLNRVDMTIDPAGFFTAAVYPLGITCDSIQARAKPPMIFSNPCSMDTAAHFLAFWQGTTPEGWPSYGLFEADFRFSWPARDTVITEVIEGRWILSVYGDCYRADETRFWLRRDPR